MTLVIGILCKDGVVVASDSEVTLSNEIGGQRAKKIFLADSRTIFSGAGDVGMGQTFLEHFKTEIHRDQFFEGVELPTKLKDKILSSLSSVGAPFREAWRNSKNFNEGFDSIVAIPHNDTPYLFSITANYHACMATDDIPWFSAGKGSPAADAYLIFIRRLLWGGMRPSLAQGKFAATWTIEYVKQSISGGVGGPIQMAVLSGGGSTWKAKEISSAEIRRLLSRIIEIETRISAIDFAQ